jgi:hypothetical protein
MSFEHNVGNLYRETKTIAGESCLAVIVRRKIVMRNPLTEILQRAMLFWESTGEDDTKGEAIIPDEVPA